MSPAPVDGTVQFRDGATNLGSPVLVSGGVASLPIPSPGVART
ncbi:hypothetical protein GTA09_25485 [Rhodococcus hoagii]|nr:hypothetical protein [Prescottella equi]